jgi:hypothetical protein
MMGGLRNRGYFQARAKLELRVVATEQDAKDVLEIFEFGMSGVFDDDIVVSSTLSQFSGNFGSTGLRSQVKNKVCPLPVIAARRVNI